MRVLEVWLHDALVGHISESRKLTRASRSLKLGP